MTRAEIFRRFPRPWRRCEGEPGAILDAKGRHIITVDQWADRPDDEVAALADMLRHLADEAEE